jgi:hypothetical protein
MKKESMSQPSRLIRDRIKELRRVKASLLVKNPKNWRIHGKQQAAALKGLLREVGYADALLARELPDGKLMLIDGHLRAETTPLQEVPVLILDVTEAEAGVMAKSALDGQIGVVIRIIVRDRNAGALSATAVLSRQRKRGKKCRIKNPC